jgi:hypothetical protein
MPDQALRGRASPYFRRLHCLKKCSSHGGLNVYSGTELEIRKKLIAERAVDVIVAVGSNFFYTVTLPVTLWFFDRGKQGAERGDRVLFIDARKVFRQIDRAHRDWLPVGVAQLLGHPGDRDVLAGDEVTDIGPQGGSITGRGGCVGWEGSGCLGSTRTPPPFGPVLGAKECDRRQVKHLAGDDAADRRF